MHGTSTPSGYANMKYLYQSAWHLKTATAGPHKRASSNLHRPTAATQARRWRWASSTARRGMPCPTAAHSARTQLWVFRELTKLVWRRRPLPRLTGDQCEAAQSAAGQRVGWHARPCLPLQPEQLQGSQVPQALPQLHARAAPRLRGQHVCPCERRGRETWEEGSAIWTRLPAAAVALPGGWCSTIQGIGRAGSPVASCQEGRGLRAEPPVGSSRLLRQLASLALPVQARRVSWDSACARRGVNCATRTFSNSRHLSCTGR